MPSLLIILYNVKFNRVNLSLVPLTHRLLHSLLNRYRLQRLLLLHKLLYKVSLRSLLLTLMPLILLHGLLAHFVMRQHRWLHVDLVHQSLAGQAIVQATIEAALPIAQADAQQLRSLRRRTFPIVSNVPCLLHNNVPLLWVKSLIKPSKHVYRTPLVSVTLPIRTFTAEQQVQLENSRAANTMNLN